MFKIYIYNFEFCDIYKYIPYTSAISLIKSLLYRVIQKFVKHFKNSQQIKYSTDHGISYADRERNSPSFFNISQMLNVSTFGNTADIYAIVHLVTHACQPITVDQSHSSGDTAAKILEISGEWRHKDSVFYKPHKKKSHRVKSGDQGGHRINASSSFPVRSPKHKMTAHVY